jgi:protein-S-isoprenylcysteine O-methyltransferase Ste14
MSLTGTWIELINRVAMGNSKYKIIFAPLVGLLYLCFICFFVIVSIEIDRIFNLPALINRPFNYFIGAPVIATGFFLMTYSIYHFLKVKGTPVPLSPPPELVTTGPYTYARNPMLAGIFMQLSGMAIQLHSISLLLIFTPLFIVINVLELKLIEEPELVKRLGKDYINYKKRVPMFFPWRKKSE